MKNLILLLLTMFIGCDPSSNSSTKKKLIVDTPSYEIIDHQLKTPMRATFHLRVEQPISKDEIRAIANSLKKSYPTYKRYFIYYYLPGMNKGERAWATSHINPTIAISILGEQ